MNINKIGAKHKLAFLLVPFVLATGISISAPQTSLAGWGGTCEDLGGIGDTPGIRPHNGPNGGHFDCYDYQACNTLIAWCACANGNYYPNGTDNGACYPPTL